MANCLNNMSNSRLTKLYLVSPTSIDKLKNVNKPKISKNSKKNNKISKKRNPTIDHFKKLKNIQRKMILMKPNAKKTEANNRQTLQKYIIDLISQLNSNKAKSQMSKQTQADLQKEISRVVNQLQDSESQTNSTEMVDQKSQTDWEEDNRAEELSNMLSRSLSFLEPINEVNEDEEYEDVDDTVDDNDVTVIERMQTTPAKTPRRTPKRRNISAYTPVRMQTTPAKTPRRRLLASNTPERMQTTPAKTPMRRLLLTKTPRQAKTGKRFSSPMNYRAHKMIRLDDFAKLPALDNVNKEVLIKRKKSRIINLRKAKISGMRKAKQRALEQLKQLKNWKRI